MDPSLINNRTRRASIVKEAPLALCERDDRPARPKREKHPRINSDCVTKCHKNVTGAHIPFEAPLRGAGASRGGDDDHH